MSIDITPSLNSRLEHKAGTFSTLTQALDYAAQGETGLNFYNLRGEVDAVLPYSELQSRAAARAELFAARFERGSRIGLVAETSPDFFVTFFACQYAGIIPVPMPMPVNLGGKEGYIRQIAQMLSCARASAAIGPEALTAFLSEAAASCEDGSAIDVIAFEAIDAMSETAPAVAFNEDEMCYIQYSSGSTSAPKGVIGTQRSVSCNLRAISVDGLHTVAGDRAVSWLPLYHDMGLIGFALAPMFGQLSIDYIATSDFVRRPLLWLRLLTENKATLTYSPSFGYELAAKRAGRAEPGSIDLSALRVAGIGGDMVRPEALNAFTDAFAPFGFDPSVFTPSYGMAEATLAISFPELRKPVTVDYVDMRHYTRSGVAQPASAVTAPTHRRGFVLCGKVLPGHDMKVRNENGDIAGEREVGRIFIKGPSLTPGYFSDDAKAKPQYDGEWLDTGDMGYMLDDQIAITGRAKDLIIINGRNIWPQDIEWAVEKVEGVRAGGVAAFSVDDGGRENIVVVVERRGGMEPEERDMMKREIAKVIQNAAGAPAEIVLARPHSLVMTSSGKLSRAKVKQKYNDGAFTDDPSINPSKANLAVAEVRV